MNYTQLTAAQYVDRDIGFSVEGQQATVKVDAFAFARYGTIAGDPVTISKDVTGFTRITSFEFATAAAAEQLSQPVFDTAIHSRRLHLRADRSFTHSLCVRRNWIAGCLRTPC